MAYISNKNRKNICVEYPICLSQNESLTNTEITRHIYQNKTKKNENETFCIKDSSVQFNFNGWNTFGTMKICLRQGLFELMSQTHKGVVGWCHGTG